MLPEIRFHLERTIARTRRMLGSLGARGWRATLHRLSQHATRPPPAAGPEPRPAPHGDGPVLLVVDAELPRPDRDSGSVRLVNLMRLLREDGYRVAFVADDGYRHGPCADALGDIGVELVQGSPVAWLRRHSTTIRGAVLCRHLVASHWLPLVRRLAPGAHVVFDTVDLHYLREERQARLHGTPTLLRQASATRSSELRLVSLADTTWVVSEHERTTLARDLPGSRVIVVSNTIDTIVEGKPFAERSGLLFVGGHRHLPNTDAVRWLLQDIFPRIRGRIPEASLHLAGPDMPSDLRHEAESCEGVVVHGHVPDLAPLLLGCRVTVAPLRFGAGVKGKINLSMAHGQPVVTTSCGAEGMHLQPGVDVVVADHPEAFAEATARLYLDHARWQSIADKGRENVRRHFSFDAARAALRRTFAPVHEPAA